MTQNPLSRRLFDDTDTAAIDPFALFEEWFAEASLSEPGDPHAAALASVDAEGLPDVRMVLVNSRDERGFVAFTNFESEKGRQLLACPRAAMVLHWKSLRRQVRLRGPVEVVAGPEADAYFRSRHPLSRLGAHASMQSRPLPARAELEARLAEARARLGDDPAERPAHWSGFRLVPLAIEFWREGAHRLHDRVRFARQGREAPWSRQRLYP